MTKGKTFWWLVVVLAIWMLPGSTAIAADPPDITGQWYGHGWVPGLGGSPISIVFVESYGLLWSQTTLPPLYLFDTYLPATIVEDPEGPSVTVSAPGLLELTGVLDGNSISGSLNVFYLGEVLTGSWYLERYLGEVFPGAAPGPACTDLPALYCAGDAAHCSSLLPFLPETGPGYLNYPINGETWEDQYRSYATREAMQLVKYAAAKVDCKAGGWSYGSLAPLGLGDMSEADGSIPGTSVGYPGHPPGSHEWGNDVDIAYFQLYALDNHLRAVGMHYEGPLDAYHLTGPPHALDVWRTALFIAYLAEHPRTRVVGVDGKIGPVVEEALDSLVESGWIDADLRASIPLAYEEENTGLGWFYFHHHHLHLSLNPVRDLMTTAELSPATLNRRSQGNYVTAHIEPAAGLNAIQIDPATVALVLDGHTLLYAQPALWEIDDYNGNGIADLTVKFDRQAVLGSVDDGTVEISITGLTDAGFFQESDTVTVLGERPQGPSQQLEGRGHQRAPAVRPGKDRGI